MNTLSLEVLGGIITIIGIIIGTCGIIYCVNNDKRKRNQKLLQQRNRQGILGTGIITNEQQRLQQANRYFGN